MAHFSKLSKVVVDIPAKTHDSAVAFWGSALGVELTRFERFPEYHGADLPTGGIGLLTQELGDGHARIHLDIHTTDRVAEVARLIRLGATLVDDGEHWAVMTDPAGLVFCVVPDPKLDVSTAKEWTD